MADPPQIISSISPVCTPLTNNNKNVFSTYVPCIVSEKKWNKIMSPELTTYPALKCGGPVAYVSDIMSLPLSHQQQHRTCDVTKALQSNFKNLHKKRKAFRNKKLF